jgi:hypothetical protein
MKIYSLGKANSSVSMIGMEHISISQQQENVYKIKPVM